jgi:hypothetical protein
MLSMMVVPHAREREAADGPGDWLDPGDLESRDRLRARVRGLPALLRRAPLPGPRLEHVSASTVAPKVGNCLTDVRPADPIHAQSP